MKETLQALLERIKTRGDLEREISHVGNAASPDYDETLLAILNYANTPDESILERGKFSPENGELIHEFARSVSSRINH